MLHFDCKNLPQTNILNLSLVLYYHILYWASCDDWYYETLKSGGDCCFYVVWRVVGVMGGQYKDKFRLQLSLGCDNFYLSVSLFLTVGCVSHCTGLSIKLIVTFCTSTQRFTEICKTRAAISYFVLRYFYISKRRGLV